MTEDELKAIVRDAVARHVEGRGSDAAPAPTSTQPLPSSHASFYRYALPRGSDTEGACLIEPAVRCTHCGYCQSHGF
jgi:hypothetical protein